MQMNQLPITIQRLFDEIHYEVSILHDHWQIYRQLFAHSRHRIDLLNENASTFFEVIHEVLYDDVQLRISKLMDSSTSSGYENMSLKALLEAVDDQSLHPILELIVKELEDMSSSILYRRKKEIAHHDLQTRMNIGTIPSDSRKNIEDILKLFRDFCNEIEGHYLDSETSFDETLSGEQLVTYVKYGMRYAELLNTGEIDRNDMVRSIWSDA